MEIYVERPQNKFPLGSFTETKSKIMERFIGIDTASFEINFQYIHFRN